METLFYTDVIKIFVVVCCCCKFQMSRKWATGWYNESLNVSFRHCYVLLGARLKPGAESQSMLFRKTSKGVLGARIHISFAHQQTS